MNTVEDFNESALAELLIKKHENLLNQYSEEKNFLVGGRERAEELKNRISVLKEKEDQLKHWLRSNNENSSQGVETYQEELNQNTSELAKLKAALKSIPKVRDADKRLPWLNQRIESHNKAFRYWNNRETKKKDTQSGREKAES
ncbi:MAG: hypothetical protein ABH950_03620 [Candidatus Altiarchaeota archaeon]